MPTIAKRFWKWRGEIVLLISNLLTEELENAPLAVREVLATLPISAQEFVARSADSERLRDAYIKSRVVGRKSLNDAHHVALASIAKADLIASWNFKHIVHWDKIRKFNAVNLLEGYPMIEIRSPKEVV